MDNSTFSLESEKLPDPPPYDECVRAKNMINANLSDFLTKANKSEASEQPGGDGTVRMNRQIGLLGGISLIVGTMIGSGIFVSPSGVLKETDSIAMSLCVWAGCGLLATFTALSYCELGTVVPRSGGEHAYFMATFKPMHRFFGELPAFLFAWMTILLLKPSSLSIASLTFGKYVLSPIVTLPGYCDDFKTSSEYELARKFIAVCIAFCVAAVNIYSARLATNVQVIFTGAKVTALVVIISIGVYNFSRGELGPIGDHLGAFDKGTTDMGKIGMAFYSGLWAFDGWNNLNFVTEELKNPHRNLPLAIMLAIPLVTILYLAVNISYLTVLDKDGLINSSAVAVDVGNQHLGRMAWIMPLLVALATFGSGNGSMYTAGRISYVAGRDGHMVDILSYVHATRLTPTIAILLNTLLAVPMIFASDINELIDFFSFAAWIFYGLALTCVIILRFTEPYKTRPFRVPLIVPFLAVLVSIFLVIVPLVTQPQLEYFYVLGFAAIGVLVYTIFVHKKWRLPYMGNLKLTDKKAAFLYFLGLILMSITDVVTKGIQCMTLVAPSPFKED